MSIELTKNAFSLSVRVYVEDTDAGRIVYHANYLKYMERARTEFLRSMGYDKAGANTESFQFVVMSADIKYIQAARLDDEVQVTAAIAKLGAASLLFNQLVLCKGEVLCKAIVKIACVDGKTLKPQPIPVHMHKDFKLHIDDK